MMGQFFANSVIFLKASNSGSMIKVSVNVRSNCNFQQKVANKYVEMGFIWWPTNVMMETYSMETDALLFVQFKQASDAKMEAAQVVLFVTMQVRLSNCQHTLSWRLRMRTRESLSSMSILLSLLSTKCISTLMYYSYVMQHSLFPAYHTQTGFSKSKLTTRLIWRNKTAQ